MLDLEQLPIDDIYFFLAELLNEILLLLHGLDLAFAFLVLAALDLFFRRGVVLEFLLELVVLHLKGVKLVPLLRDLVTFLLNCFFVVCLQLLDEVVVVTFLLL